MTVGSRTHGSHFTPERRAEVVAAFIRYRAIYTANAAALRVVAEFGVGRTTVWRWYVRHLANTAAEAEVALSTRVELLERAIEGIQEQIREMHAEIARKTPRRQPRVPSRNPSANDDGENRHVGEPF
jgi:predicted trehalose synthase